MIFFGTEASTQKRGPLAAAGDAAGGNGIGGAWGGAIAGGAASIGAALPPMTA